jgi:uncharacterized protein YehS (DUF1456 family)
MMSRIDSWHRTISTGHHFQNGRHNTAQIQHCLISTSWIDFRHRKISTGQNGDRPVEIVQCRESIRDIIIYPHIKFWWNRTMLNFCGIVATILKMAISRKFLISGINSGYHYLLTIWHSDRSPLEEQFCMFEIFDMSAILKMAATRHKIWTVKIQHCAISSKFDMWVDNNKRSKNNKSPKLCLGDLIITDYLGKHDKTNKSQTRTETNCNEVLRQLTIYDLKTRAVAPFFPDARTFHNMHKWQKHVLLRHQSYLIVFMGNTNLWFWQIMPLLGDLIITDYLGKHDKTNKSQTRTEINCNEVLRQLTIYSRTAI